MKDLKYLLIVLLCGVQTAFGQVEFLNGSISDAFAAASKQNKILMVDVFTDWCKWCVELDNKVYADSEVAAFANANQINYKIDAEKGEGIDFARKYDIKGYPTVLFLDKSGKEIDRIYGYLPKKEFLEIMQDYNKGVNTMDYLKNALDKNPDDIETNLKIADKYIVLGEDDKARTHLNRIIQSDPGNAAGKTDDAKFKLTMLAKKEDIIKDLETFIKDYPESNVFKDACLSLAENYYGINSDIQNADKCYSELLAKYPDDESVRSSYGQYLNARALTLADKGKGPEDYNEGLKLIQSALPYVKGSVNEASSYYLQSRLYYNLKQYPPALEAVNKALKIFNRKLYRDHKEKIEKELK